MKVVHRVRQEKLHCVYKILIVNSATKLKLLRPVCKLRLADTCRLQAKRTSFAGQRGKSCVVDCAKVVEVQCPSGAQPGLAWPPQTQNTGSLPHQDALCRSFQIFSRFFESNWPTNLEPLRLRAGRLTKSQLTEFSETEAATAAGSQLGRDRIQCNV